MSALEYWVWFATLPGLRTSTRRRLLETYASPTELFYADERSLRRDALLHPEELDALLARDTSGAKEVLRRCDALGVTAVALPDTAYPARLRAIPDPPAVLYVSGRLPAVDDEPCIAVVGTRKCSAYGEKMAWTMGWELAAGGGVVVTGLAGGIDTRAAQGALAAGGRVIGVLGVAIDRVYPRNNARLYDDVRAVGALVSEYPPGAEGYRSWFAQRDRIMAGLSLAAVVVEAPVRSGALITAHCAADYGRDVFAVPGNTGVDTGQGSNNLLREGASLAETGWDVLGVYQDRFPEKILSLPEGKRHLPPELVMPGPGPEAPVSAGAEQSAAGNEKQDKPETGTGFWKHLFPGKHRETTEEPRLSDQLSGLSERQLRIVGVMEKPNMHVDDIADLARLPAAAVVSELTMLQIKGFVQQESGKRFSLRIKQR